MVEDATMYVIMMHFVGLLVLISGARILFFYMTWSDLMSAIPTYLVYFTLLASTCGRLALLVSWHEQAMLSLPCALYVSTCPHSLNQFC